MAQAAHQGQTLVLIATANDVESLPPEFLRKGRFDEIFFVDLPAQVERAEIFRLHLAKRHRDPEAFDLQTLGEAADGFSGAEIEAGVAGALYRAYAAGRDLTTDDLLAEIQASPPLSRNPRRGRGRASCVGTGPGGPGLTPHLPSCIPRPPTRWVARGNGRLASRGPQGPVVTRGGSPS